MAISLSSPDAWFFSPYCFCKDRPWLTVDNVGYIGDDGGNDGAGGGGGVATIPGLSDEETALLAALLTALAVFLFLLFLLLCLLCPFGLCCGDKGACCASTGAGSRGKSNKTSAKPPSLSSSDSVNLTAVDMKIPRAWMDNYAGLSDSELDKRYKAWGKGVGGTWGDGHDTRWLTSGDGHEDIDSKRGYLNTGFNTMDFKDGGWFSASDLDSVYGAGSVRRGHRRSGSEGGIGKEMVALEEFYTGGDKKGSRSRSSSATHLTRTGHAQTNLESLMTTGHASSSFHSDGACSYGNSGGHYGNASVASETGSGYTKLTESMTVARQAAVIPAIENNRTDPMNAVSEMSLTDQRDCTAQTRATSSQSGLMPYTESHMTTSIMTSTEENGDLVTKTDMKKESQLRETSDGMYSERSAFTRRVVEETTTTLTQ